MALSLNDMAGNTSPARGVHEVNVSDIPVEKKAPVEKTDYMSKQMNALDEMISNTPAPIFESNGTTNDEELDKVVDENLENYNPEEDDGPLAPAAEPVHENGPAEIDKPIVPTAEPAPEIKKVSEMGNDADTKPAPEKTEKETEKEFNKLFQDDDDDDFLSNVDTEDLEASDQDDETDEDKDNANLEAYKKEMKNYIKQTIVDTTGFAVANKGISMSKLLNVEEPTKQLADWIAPTAKKSFSTVEYSGIDIQKLTQNTSNQQNAIGRTRDIYKTLYNHLVGATKGGFENWLKTTPYKDVEHYYFGAYKATFGGGMNAVTYQCEDKKCNKMFIVEQPIDKLYEVDEDYQEEFDKIFQGDTSLATDFQEDIIPVSDKFAIGIIEPSIYSVEIESLLITQEMRETYARIIGLLPFIKQLYFIDTDKRAFVPIEEKVYKDDIAKTVKYKLNMYYKVLGTLSNDQIATIQALPYNYRQEKNHITYVYPECTCPACGKKIEKQTVSPVEMLFNRAQSGLVANLSESSSS